ncbi:4-hydroxythreonine-4-phosphate dehydrogenase [Mitsuaria sp. BK045]|uniref:4-hydroxythreonine-4-phosphate dehydrogenase PdxA n=1 Tax=unclassified Roseateles TaxID=2626991 RepID=UPI00162050CA|nr:MULTISPECIES: 4-hydroxythreonine-4-phosphate dehydrogenase PdxA [unclassified Roseateles]MBB3292010.1 4-hydroxythreonine-4-phosphate dehydrogenase [Mitsuaria sp. BK041]MBB3361227.1 4-hydroxythreonine-4-phosphate dehydrogenase [Mitsuaria sp. BK045]
MNRPSTSPPSPRPSPRPLLLTMGDACGIGPEIAVAAWARDRGADLRLVGDVAVFRRAVGILGLDLPVAVLEQADDPAPPDCLPVWQPPGLPADLVDQPLGRVSAAAGAAAARCIVAAVHEQQAGRSRALVTAPIHKEALHAGGIDHPGHTELLQALCADAQGQLPPVRMMLANEELRVVLVTIHVALRQAVDQITTGRVLQTLRITDAALRRAGLDAPRIAVAGLNPHAGEGGLFGTEEIEHIAPAIAQARTLGIDAHGPFAPDTVFMRARHAPPRHVGEFDAVVAMTHDQGLIPVKYLGVEEGVNVTLGLPLVRTSPDHGTAFDIAGTGRADPSSMAAAIRMARAMSA